MNKEEHAYREFQRVSELLPPSVAESTPFPVLDFGKALAGELRSFRSRKFFTKLDGYRSILWVSNHSEMRPSAICARMRELDVRFDHIRRVMPLDIITGFDPEQIRRYILGSYAGGSFKIQYEGRLCDSETRERVFGVILPLMTGKVVLDAPEYVVVVQAFRGHLGVSVVGRDARNFNFSNN